MGCAIFILPCERPIDNAIWNQNLELFVAASAHHRLGGAHLIETMLGFYVSNLLCVAVRAFKRNCDLMNLLRLWSHR